jgi:intracellular multiplication protein IcmM
MGKFRFTQIKQHKLFYIRSYRRSILLLYVSLTMNVLLFFGMVGVYITQKPSDYYATSGVASPIQLSPLDSPNMTSEPLLPPDPVDDSVQNQLPNE